MDKKNQVFEELREAVQIAKISGSQGLNYDGEDTQIQSIEGSVRKFRQRLLEDSNYSTNRNYQKMIKQLDQYWDKLFADPIQVDTPNGKVIIQP